MAWSARRGRRAEAAIAKVLDLGIMQKFLAMIVASSGPAENRATPGGRRPGDEWGTDASGIFFAIL
jgi:hypothetical protein